MKININSINPTLVVEITGSEPWLGNIYSDYFSKDDRNHARLTGKVKLQAEEAGTFVVTADLKFVPALPCSRCEKSIAWPLDVAINLRYLPELSNTLEKEKNLTPADLEAYYVEDGRIDLEVLVNDAINDAIPLRVQHTKEGDTNCLTCGKDLSGDKIWSSQDEKPSPFAVLKGLKLPN
jgi:uncharacterized metal-binding protein YceD (DUF177 family)